MQQAILITVYKHADWVERIIRCLGSDFAFFLHIDLKVTLSDAALFRELDEQYANVRCFSSFQVNWGGFNHLRAILLLVEEALASGAHLCHLITGQDYPVKSRDYFLSELRSDGNFMESFQLPTQNWKGGGLDRLWYYHFYDVFDRKTYLGKKIIRNFGDFQKLLPFRRKLPSDITFYGGSTYWTLNRSALEYVFYFVKRNPCFLNMFQYSFCAEEIFFQTVLMNSPFRDSIVNSSRRFICWEQRYGSQPAILDETDFNAIMASDTLFARKIAYPESSMLAGMIDREVHGVASSLCD